MKPLILPLILLAAACSDSDTTPTKNSANVVDLKKTEKRAEPDFIRVDHILISFSGAPRAKATRSKEEARQLAYDIVDQLHDGADWSGLKAKYSNDPGPDGKGGGPYGMRNSMAGGPGMRGGMVAAFGNVGFQLLVGEIAIADWDAIKSPFGWHIIKRVE